MTRPTSQDGERGVLGKSSWMVALTVVGATVLGVSVPTAVWAAEKPQRFGAVLFGLALLMVLAKLGGLLAKRWRQAPVLGELLVGVGLGNLMPLFFDGRGVAFLHSEPTLLILAEIGILILLFDLGLETDLRSLARVGLSSSLVALTGMVIPLLLGWGAAAWFFPDRPAVVHIFVGATLAATSVGITARVLKDLGATQRKEAQIILGAAILDDVLGIILLALIGGVVTAAATGAPGPSVLTGIWILLKAVLFLGFTIGLGIFLSPAFVRLVARSGEPGTFLVFGLALCFVLAFVAEQVGLAGIIGAFAAGVMLDPYGEGVRSHEEEATLSELLDPLSSFFVPLFFILMGIQVHLESLVSPVVLGFGLILILCAVGGKLACSIGVVERGVNRLAVGVGMIPRGEVGLIFAGIGTSLSLEGQPVLSQGIFTAIVLMVLVTTLLAPIGLRWAFGWMPVDRP